MKRAEVGHKSGRRYPELPRTAGTDKEALRISSNTTMRARAPTNPHTAKKVPDMVWDFSKQQKVWPNGNNKTLVEATQVTGPGLQNYAFMNRATGRPYALGTMVGGAPDDGGTVFERAPRRRIIKG